MFKFLNWSDQAQSNRLTISWLCKPKCWLTEPPGLHQSIPKYLENVYMNIKYNKNMYCQGFVT